MVDVLGADLEIVPLEGDALARDVGVGDVQEANRVIRDFLLSVLGSRPWEISAGISRLA
jgi:hypothetical protein